MADAGPSLLQSVQRDVNCLAASATASDVNPLPSLKKLKDVLFGRSRPSVEAVQFFYNNSISAFVGVLGNSRDSSREQAMDMIREYVSPRVNMGSKDVDDSSISFSRFVTVVPDLSAGLPFIIPTLAMRMGLHPVQESCEEVRQKGVRLITSLVVAVGPSLAAYIEDIVNILCRAFVDPFPEVRKVCSPLIGCIGPIAC
jgi:hypothetical protein